jgi:hypothetical protein
MQNTECEITSSAQIRNDKTLTELFELSSFTTQNSSVGKVTEQEKKRFEVSEMVFP